MKKTLVALLVAAASSGASADTIYGIYAGAGNWMSSYEGEAGAEAADLEDLNLEDTDNLYFYLALEHPVPVIPNIRLAHTQLQVDGRGVLTSSFQLDEQEFSAQTEILTDFDLTHTDGTLYYELLDNWISFDLGVTARLFDGYVQAANANDATQSERVEFNEVIPMGYARAQIDFPMTGWHVSAGGNYVAYNGDSFSDMDVKFGYMSDGFVMDLGLDVGYRRVALDVSDGDDLQADLTIAGPYVEVGIHF